MPPNILLTFADDQRHTMLGCCDGPTADGVRTPHLDALAQRGCRLTHAYHAGSAQGAVCVPSRAMLHSGRGPFDLDPEMALHNVGPGYGGAADAPTLGQLLRQAGYITHHVGKWHNGEASFKRSFDTASAVFAGGMADHFHTPVQTWDGNTLRNASQGGCHSTDIFSEAARDWLRHYAASEDGNRPFFLCVAFTAPHDPRQTHRQWHERYPVDAVDLPPNFLGEHPFDNATLNIRDELLTSRPRDERQTRYEIADYCAMTEHMDHGIGRIHELLRDLGLQDDTLVIHSGDHGLAVGQHGLMGKQNLYDHSTRVPLIVAGPNVPQSQRRDGLCYQHDLFPTLLEAGEVDDPTHTPFRSLWPMLRGEKQANYDRVGCFYSDEQRMVTDGKAKLIRYRVGGQTFEQRFDLEADPWEQLKADGSPLHESDGLDDAAFEQWQRDVGDPWLG